MQLRVILIAFLLALFITDARAQFWKKDKKDKTGISIQQPSSLSPGNERRMPERGTYAPRGSQRSAKASRGPTYDRLVEEYYERMEAVAKAYKRAERMLEKPQYSNPMYFGHKRPPKKHKPSKMKYCKVCGIRH